MNVIHPVLLTPSIEDVQRYREPLERLLRRSELWWESYGVYLYHAGIKALWGHQMDLMRENPWHETRQRMAQEGYPEGHGFLVFLRGWNDPRWAGWGGPGLAVVGDWALSVLASLGSPEALVDDDFAGKLVLHETGHVLGLGHNFKEPTGCDVMDYGWCGFNSTLEQRLSMESIAGCELPRGR